MKSLYVGVIMLSAGCFLSACGGGGQGVMPNVRDGPMDDSMTMTPPTANDIRETLARIGSTADHLLMTDVVGTSRSQSQANTRSDTVCQGMTCTTDLLSLGVVTFTKTVSDFTSFDAEAIVRPGALIHGVPSGEIRFQVTVEDPASQSRATTDHTVFGGWLEHNAFGVFLNDARVTIAGESSREEALEAFSLGNGSGTNPVSGSATWRGAMVGRDDANPAQTVTGQAALTYDFGDNTVDLTMSQIRGPRTYADMTWQGLGVSDGRFASGSDSNSLEGAFYGDNHEEVGGVFERNEVIGAFGATRQ